MLASGALCGAINGLIVIFGRLQPIVTTIATGAMFYGLALFLRPFPGGSVNETIADFMTSKAFGIFPMSFVALAVIVLGGVGALQPFGDRARILCGGLIGTCGLYVRHAGEDGEVHWPMSFPACLPPSADFI